MRPFNLEQAKQGKKVVTSGGNIGLYVASVDNKYPHVFAFENKNQHEQFVGLYDNNGLCISNQNSMTLFMATEKKTVYIGVANGENQNYRLTTNAFFSESALKEYAGRGVVMNGQHQIVSFEIEV